MKKIFNNETVKLSITIGLVLFVVLGAIFLVFDFPKENVLAEDYSEWDEIPLTYVSTSYYSGGGSAVYSLPVDFELSQWSIYYLYITASIDWGNSTLGGTETNSIVVYFNSSTSLSGFSCAKNAYTIATNSIDNVSYLVVGKPSNSSYSSGYYKNLRVSNIHLYVKDFDEYFNKGYQEGIEFADGRVNTASASYVFGVEEGYDIGYDAGIEYAKNTIDDTSVSYTYGYNLGYHEAEEHYLNVITSSDLYQLGFDAGVEFADTRVNTESASYVSGYSNGYQAGYNFAWNTINIASPNFMAGFISYNSGLFSTSTFNASMVFTDSTGNNSYNKSSNFDTSMLGFFIDNGEGRGAVDFKSLRTFLHHNFATTESDLLMNLDISLTIPTTQISKDVKFYFNGQSDNLDVFVYNSTLDNPDYIYLILDNANAPFYFKFNSSSYGSEFDTLVYSWNYLESWDNCYTWNINTQYQSGYNAGVYFADHRVNESSKSYTQGVIYANSTVNDKSESYKVGYQNGYNTVNTSSATYLQAYNKGYNAGADRAGNYTFLSLMSSVIDAPIKALTGLLDFNVLGFNLKTVVISLISTAAVVAVLFFFLGKKRG